MSDFEGVDVSERFPKLKPISSPPPLMREWGCGVSVFGCRDFDHDTRSYVTNWCLTVLFVPVLALRAYRVADAEHGWYFIGREPLSGFARMWNVLVLAAVAAVVASNS